MSIKRQIVRVRIKAADNKICTFTFALVKKDFGAGQLKVITKNLNDCLPRQLCNNLHANTVFSNHIFTLRGNSYEEELEIPASESGWNIQFFPPPNEGPVQYDVRQNILEDADFPYNPGTLLIHPVAKVTLVSGIVTLVLLPIYRRR